MSSAIYPQIPLDAIPGGTPARILAELKEDGKHDRVSRIHSKGAKLQIAS